MIGFFHALRRKWGPSGKRGAPSCPFRIACSCGQVLQGMRSARHQVIICPGCRESYFIFPRSPLPPVESAEGLPSLSVVAAPPWRKPVLAAGLTLLVVIVGLVCLTVYLAGGFRQRP